MVSIIIAFPNIDNAKSIKKALTKNEFEINAVCTTGTSVISYANQLDEGIIICGYKLQDMMYSELKEYLPKTFDMILVTSPTKIEEGVVGNIDVLELPLKVNTLIDLLNKVESRHVSQNFKSGKPRNRTVAQMKEIAKAKEILMKKNDLSEDEAHRYIQKTSMDNGTSMVETSQMIVRLFG